MAIIERVGRKRIHGRTLFCRTYFKIDDRAAGPVRRPNRSERGKSTRTFGNTESAPRLEGAARRHGMNRRDRALDGSQGPPALGPQIGHGLQQAASVWM